MIHPRIPLARVYGVPCTRQVRSATRLDEMLSGATDAAKLRHLFARTPESARAKLQLDAEVGQGCESRLCVTAVRNGRASRLCVTAMSRKG